jgi:2-oxoacid dehydrogenases acyltransferase (catalytic domain)
MNQKIGPYHVVDLPAARREIPNYLDLIWWKHCIYGMLEVDVTVTKQFIEEYKAQTGELLSFTGYLVFCFAQAVEEDKSVQAYLKGRKQLVLFDDVDVGMTIERQIDGAKAPMGHIMRAANRKSYLEIHQEIRAVQARPVPPNKGMAPWFRTAMLLPWPLPRLVNALIRTAMRRDPTSFVSMGGTVGVTAVGMFGEGQGGWGLVPLPYSVGLVVGSTAWKPAIVDGRIEPREILNLTVVFDHDVIDGAPASRFARKLIELIESGYGLPETDRAAFVEMDRTPVEIRVDHIA